MKSTEFASQCASIRDKLGNSKGETTMRRVNYFFLFGALLTTSAVLPPAQADEPHAAKQWVFIGTYTGGKTGSKGIYRCEFDPATGKLTEPELAAEVASPSFLAVHPTKRFLYAVGELSEFNGKKG